MAFDVATSDKWISASWEEDLTAQLESYIAIPALSPAFDPEWSANGYIDEAVSFVHSWLASRPLAGMTVTVERLPGLTPVIVAEVEPFGDVADVKTTTILYGHLDKQPEMEGWRPDLGPWKPVREGDRLYGRGGADDGYAAFASVTALEAVQRNGGSHGRCVILIEASEESGSPDLPAHIDALADRLGDVGLVVCLDSGCATYDTLWLTTSLRGLVDGTLDVSIVTEGLHSGSASGVVPSTFRIARQLLDRIEDAYTGAVLVEAANVDIPEHRIDEAKATAELFGPEPVEVVPFVENATAVVTDPVEALLAKTWRPALSTIGVDGMPSVAAAGNVLRPRTALKLSLRIPPTADPAVVEDQLREMLEKDPPYGASVAFVDSGAAAGWNAPDLAPWLRSALDEASTEQFGKPVQLFGEGGSIPFMGMLGEKFPRAQFVITGVLGPESNAHGPNEFLHLRYAERLTACLAQILDSASRVTH